MPAANFITPTTPEDGGGKKMFRGTVTLDFASTATLVLSAGLAVTGLVGVKQGDFVLHIAPVGGQPSASGRFEGYCDADGQATFYYRNTSAGTVDLASAIYEFIILSKESV